MLTYILRRIINVDEWMLMWFCCLAGRAVVKIWAHIAFIANTFDRVRLTAITNDVWMLDSAFLVAIELFLDYVSQEFMLF
jgi:hypothetical protein